MAKWSLLLVLALVVVHASARNVPTTITMTANTAPSSMPSGAPVDDQKNFLTYGAVGGFSGIGSTSLPFGGVGSLGGFILLSGVGGLGGLGVGIKGVGSDGGLGGLEGTGGLIGLGRFGGLGGGDGDGAGVRSAVGGGVEGVAGASAGGGTGVLPFPLNIDGGFIVNSLSYF